MSTQQILPQNGLRVGEQIVAEGDDLSLGNNVGVKNNLTVGGSVFTNRVITPSVTKEHVGLRTIEIDCAYSDHRILLRSNALGFSFINVPSASQGTFRLKVYLVQDTFGNKTVDFSPNTTSGLYQTIIWTNPGPNPNSTPIYPVLQTLGSKVDVFEFITFDGGQQWVGSQINPTTVSYNSFTDVVYALGNSVSGSAPAMPASYPGSSVIPNFSGTIIQTKVVTSTAATDFSTGNYTDLMTMSFSPKYKNTRLLLIADVKHGTAGTSYSSHFMFTIGTTPISGPNVLSTLGNGTNNTVNQSQNTHFGGYQQAIDTNHVEFKHGTISFAHNFDAGTNLDLRLRGRHADAWSDNSLILNRSWGFPDGAYSASNTSSFTVMEYIP
jgi:hypothetical protein